MAETQKPMDLSIGTFSDEQLARVLQGFGLTSYVVLPFFSLNDEIIDLRRRTTTSKKVLIEHDGSVWFLKELPWYCSSIPFARFQSVLQDRLRMRGLPVPQLTVSISGELFYHDDLTNGIFLLQEYAVGRGWSTRPAQARAAGEVLGRMHQACTVLDLSAPPGTRNVFESATALNALLFHAYAGTEPEAVSAYAELADEVIKRCRDRAYEAGYGSRPMPVHGDFNPYNLVFDEQGVNVAAIIDFDNACLDDPMHDVAEAVVRFAWMNYRGVSSAYGDVPEVFRADQATAILDGYRVTADESLSRALPFLPEVITAIAVELAAIGLLSAYYDLSDLDQLGRNLESLPPMAREAVGRAR